MMRKPFVVDDSYDVKYADDIITVGIAKSI